MGYSTEALLIKPAIDEEQYIDLLAAIGYDHIQPLRKSTLEEVDDRQESVAYIGQFSGATIVIASDMFSDLPGHDNFIPMERKIANFLPDHELLSVINMESVNAYRYHYIVHGKSIRYRDGSADYGMEESGDELPEERHCYKYKEKDGDEFIYYTDIDGEKRAWRHHQIGGSIAFELARKFVGVAYHQIPSALEMNYYSVEEDVEKKKAMFEDELHKEHHEFHIGQTHLPPVDKLEYYSHDEPGLDLGDLNDEIKRRGRATFLILLGLIVLVTGLFTSWITAIFGGVMVTVGAIIRYDSKQ